MAFKDLAGKRFGCLVALRTDGKRGRFIVWLCQCDCGETCSVLVNHLPNGHTRSCGCVRQRTNKKQLERRLLSLRQITESGCWEWLGSKARGGYGQAAYKKKVHKVHRLAAHVWSGFDLSSELMVCHKCDNPPCFNPEHLFSGTASDKCR